MMKIEIAREYSKYPGGRFKKHGPGSGEEFRDSFLLPMLLEGEAVEVLLDGVAGYPASFLEEAFGGLVRSGVSLNQLEKLLKVVAKDPLYNVYVDLAWEYIRDANDDLNNTGSPH